MANKTALAVALACALLGPAGAQAEIVFKESFGASGGGAGGLSTPAGLAINTANSNVYVADRGNNRVEQLTAAGAFVRAWGYDVVASGPDNKALANEVEEVRIRAGSGSFSLTFGGQETAQLAFDASAASVESALNALPGINAGGGSVTVSGGPGDLTGSTPYVVTFSGGPLAGTNVQLGLEASGLGLPPGTQLSCEGSAAEAEAFEYQWLVDGTPVPGATAATFTPGAGEEGKTIQCRVTAAFGIAKTLATSRPYRIASPAPATLPPRGAAAPAAPSGKPILESVGGTPLVCNAGFWTRGFESFTYRWYRNGVEIGSPTTTTETTDEYTLTQADVATRAVFQCGVTGHNAGGSSTTISKFLATEPQPINPEAKNAAASTEVSPLSASGVLTRTNGGAVLEVCQAGDTCKAGIAGNGFGQLDKPRSIAVDNSASGGGAVYVMDDGNPRVQKFSATGTPILEIGGEVDQTTQTNLCTVVSGDACGGGVLDKAAAPGAFGAAPEFSELGNELGVDANGDLYAGDPRADADPTQPRIEKFDSDGNFLAQAKVPYLFGSGSVVKPLSVAVDSSGLAYASLPGEAAGVEKFSVGEFTASGDGTQRPGNVFDQSGKPVQLAVDPRNDRLLASDANKSELLSVCGGPGVSHLAVYEYDTSQNRIDCTVPSGAGALAQVTGMAVSSAGLLYAAVGSANKIKSFELPVSKPPSILSQSATEITTETALIHGEINPGFEDTTYSVEYGLEKCASTPCEKVVGGVLRGLKFVDGATQISGLAPNTTYHYRVVAENPLGTIKGPDRTFTTFPLVDLVNDACPNALARKQTKTVGLLDCRAYELASAAFTGGYDVVSNLVPGQQPFQGFPEAPGKLLYGVKDGGIPGTGNPTNRGLDPYVATRDEDGTWSTKYVGIPSDNPFALAPFSSTLAGADSSLATFAFAGEICDPCFEDGSTGLPVRLPNGELVQGMTGSEPDPTAEPAGYVAKPLSLDGSHLLFGTDAKLEPTANEGGDATIYSRDLGSETTEVISTDEAGNTLSGAEVGALDVSTDGSRVLIGAEVSADGAGNPLWHLYLHLAGDPESVDLMAGASEGAYFDGMTADGTRLFLTTKEQLLGEDTDESADIYEARLDEEGNPSLRLVSTLSDGTPSNSNACTPPNEPATWNAPAGNGKCGALAFAGGAGVASSSGDLYFLSPERLEGTKGTLHQPNLYRVEPDGYPHFVATIDTSVGKPGPKPPEHPLVDSSFGDGDFVAVEALTVDQSSGDLYAIDALEGKVYRYESSGAPKAFTAGPHEANALTGFAFGAFSEAEVALDDSAGPLSGDIYVAGESGVGIFAPGGEQLGSLDGSATNKGAWTTNACGVAVDKSNGAVYVADSRGYIWQYTPAAPAAPLTDADYTVKGIKPEGMVPCALAADSASHLFAAAKSDGSVRRFVTGAFATGAPPTSAGLETGSVALALAADQATHDLYVDEGEVVSVFNSAGNPVASIGQGKLSCGFLGSRGVAVNTSSHHVYASCFEPSTIKEFGYEVPPYTPVDNPAILDAAHPLTHNWGDFQVTPEGEFAIFATSMPLQAGYDNASRYEVYRYAPGTEELLCVSCDPTGSQAQSDSTLPPDGLGLLEDGRVFFSTDEQLTLSDTNEKLDAYEFSPQREGVGGCALPQGCRQLISTGTSAHPSGLLGVSSDGKDAFFFTRDELVGEDRNGQAMKVYDARSEGGHFVIPPPPPCAASDECHGAGTQAPPPPQIGTFKGSGGEYEEAATPPKACKKPKVRRKGRCVKPHKKARHKKAAHKRGKR
jgi:sugar lactone lactonase YvrE